MAAEAERGLEWRREYGRGGTEVGVARARDISNRATLSPDTVRRMKSYFARHEVDKQAEGFSPGEDGYPSAGRIAWALWGGDPGQAWANARVDEMDGDKALSSKRLRLEFNVKALHDNEFEGYGSIFGNVDLGGDIVMKGAFRKTLAEHRKAGTLPQMFWMHDPAQVPGKWLEMSEDDDGLYVKGQFADTQLGREVRTLLTMKAVRGLSIGYMITDSDYDKNGNRLIKAADLWEVSVVSLAMNPQAQVESVKARLSASGEYVQTKREFERFLRDSGYSRAFALKMASQLGDDPRDADGTEDGVADSINQLSSRLLLASYELA
jgi:hypothetical protein